MSDSPRGRAYLPAATGKLARAARLGRLRATVGQLEHALPTRIRVEQAIGVLGGAGTGSSRGRHFEQLRDSRPGAADCKVIDIAGDVVAASATNPLLQLPDELSRPRTGPRRGRPAAIRRAVASSAPSKPAAPAASRPLLRQHVGFEGLSSP